jgi:hypothetical protein
MADVRRVLERIGAKQVPRIGREDVPGRKKRRE